MKTELLYLSYVTILTGVLWIPYILDRVLTCGLLAAVGYPDNSKPQSKWAVRLMKAHSNAVCYTLGIPWVRTLAFLTGVAAQAMVAVQLLAH